VAFDQKSLVILNALYPDIKTRAIRFEQDVLKVLNLQIRITEGYRSQERQAKLYDIGRNPADKSKIVTNAKPGESVHNYALAFDLCINGPDPYLSKYPKKQFDETWRKIGETGIQNGFKWGYDWNGNGLVDGNDFDRPHFELTYGERVCDLRELYNHNGLVAVFARMDQRRGVTVAQNWNDLTIKAALLSLN